MTIYLVDIEPVETRYTKEWKEYIPDLIRENTSKEVRVISGVDDIPAATTEGAFLNFGGTNVYKAAQVEKIGRLFCDGKVVKGDHFLFTDAWHPGIINLKYMSELLGIPVTTHGLWHAGSYDPQDFLGRLIGDEPWIRHAEKSFFYAYDHNYFATKFHINMFLSTLRLDGNDSITRTGWPMSYMKEVMWPFKNIKKRDLILFPHRIAPEKQPEIFADLAKRIPEYEFIMCQETPLSKYEYHTLLGEAKMVFSCALQETLGIVGYEGALVDAIPLVPNRLSYTEMYQDRFKYPSEWTESFESYVEHRAELIKLIRYLMTNYDDFVTSVQTQEKQLSEKFFSATTLLKALK